MSNVILSRTLGAITDKRLSLGGGQALRLLEYTDTWTRVRIGIQLAFNAGANISGTPILAVGLCKGTANGFSDPSTDHFLGVVTQGATMTYNAGPTPTLEYSATNVAKKIGTTLTVGSGFGSGFISSDPTVNRSFLIVDITKGSPFTVKWAYPNTIGAGRVDVTDALMIALMEASTFDTSSLSGILANTVAQSTTIVIDETTNGHLDSISLNWDRSGTPLEISAVRHKRIS